MCKPRIAAGQVNVAVVSIDQRNPSIPALGREEPVPGILMILAALMVFSCSDALSKFLSATLPPIEIAWLRWLGFVLIFLPVVAGTRGRVLITHAPAYEIGRALGLLGSSVLFIFAIQSLPLASATTIGFVSPMLVTILSIPLLGEKVRARRWAAVIVGFVGVLVVVRPGLGTFELAAIFPLLSSLCWAFGVIFTRKASRSDGPLTAMAYTAIVGFAILTPLVWPIWVWPTPVELGTAAAMAVCATGGQFLTTLAYRRAPASVLAPFAYVQLISAATFGYVLFGNVPDRWTGLGAAIIAASGLYTAHRERVRAVTG